MSVERDFIANNAVVKNKLVAREKVVTRAVNTRGFSLRDGTEATGYVLTSDADGNGTWQESSGGSGAVSSVTFSNFAEGGGGNIVGTGATRSAFYGTVANGVAHINATLAMATNTPAGTRLFTVSPAPAETTILAGKLYQGISLQDIEITVTSGGDVSINLTLTTSGTSVVNIVPLSFAYAIA